MRHTTVSNVLGRFSGATLFLITSPFWLAAGATYYGLCAADEYFAKKAGAK